MSSPRSCKLTPLTLSLAPALLLAVAAGCSAAGGEGQADYVAEFDPVGGAEEPIINPTGTATGYPYAALVDMGGGLCSGSVIAPACRVDRRTLRDGRELVDRQDALRQGCQ